ncbi:MAG: hypothetical protein Kow0037_21350 [Calditrichia bacterium]
MRIETLNNRVFLYFQTTDLQEFDGFRVYRSTTPEDSGFIPLAYIPAGQKQFIDSTVTTGRWYYYRATLLAAGQESLPSNTVKALLGPGSVWVLSRYGYSLHHLAYDLENTINIIGTNYPPKSWAPDFVNKQIWTAYPPFGLIGHINLILNYEDQLIGDSLKAPNRLAAFPDKNTLFVADTLVNRIFVLKNGTVENNLNVSAKGVHKLLVTSNRHLYVLYKSRLAIFNFAGQLQKNIFFPTGFEGTDLRGQNGLVLAIAAGPEAHQTALLKIDDAQLQHTQKIMNGYFRLLRPLPGVDEFWAVENLPENSSRLVKLSPDGIRLLELSDFDYILDLAVNPADFSLVIINAPPNYGYTREIQLRNEDGTLLNRIHIFDALKVAISE